MAGSTVLSPEAVMRIKTMYEQRDERGRRVHSLMSLGKAFGVSETTILRAIKSYGAFMAAPDPMPELTPEEINRSAERLMKLLAEDDSKPGVRRAKDMTDMTPSMRERLIGYHNWNDEDEKAWQKKMGIQTS